MQAQVMEPLVRLEGFGVLKKIAEQQILNHMAAWANDPSTTRDIDQFRKGAIHGIRTLLNTPEQILEHRSEILGRMLDSDTPVKPNGEIPNAPIGDPPSDDTTGTYQASTEPRAHGD
jgi:hypothetical protein